MQIEIVIFGKIKDSNFKNLFDYYVKLINKYAKCSIQIVKDKNAKISINDIQKLQAKNKLLILLDENGENFNTIEFAEFLKKCRLQTSKVVFVVGNAFGFDDTALQVADMTLSLSNLTMAHELACVVLSEQLFRCLNLLAKGHYHK